MKMKSLALTTEQSSLLKYLTNCIDKNRTRGCGALVVLDAPPGTGKTTLMSTLCSLQPNATVIACQRSNLIPYRPFAKTLSICQFLLRCAKMTYEEAWSGWPDCQDAYETYSLVAKVAGRTFIKRYSLIIVDEYSMVPSLSFLYLLILREYFKIHLVFVGDRSQLTPIKVSKHLPKSNYGTLFRFGSGVQALTLNRQMRFVDSDLAEVVDKIRWMVENLEDNNENRWRACSMVCHNRKRLLLIPSNPKNLYLASYHVKLAERTNWIENQATTKTKRSYYRLASSNPDYETLTLDDACGCEKYLPYLLLAEGFPYWYRNGEITEMVTLVNIDDDVIIVMRTNGENIELKREPVDTPSPQEQWLLKQHVREPQKNIRLYQFPLKSASVATYHSVQGMTVPDNLSVEIDLDVSSLSALYVGISRLRRLDQLHCLRSRKRIQHLLSEPDIRVDIKSKQLVFELEAISLKDEKLWFERAKEIITNYPTDVIEKIYVAKPNKAYRGDLIGECGGWEEGADRSWEGAVRSAILNYDPNTNSRSKTVADRKSKGRLANRVVVAEASEKGFIGEN